MSELNRTLAPEFQQITNIEFIHPENHRLDNGIVINALSGGSQEILKIDFIFQAGQSQQKKPLIANACNLLMKEGSKKYTSKEIADGIDQYGAFLQSDVSFDNATFTLYTMSKHLDKVMPYFKEVICHPSFSEKEFDIYQLNSIEKFKINMEKVSFLARKEFMCAVFGDDTPLGRNTSLKDYQNLSLAEIKQFYSDFYDLNNCEIIISGKVAPKTINSLNTFFGKQNIGEIPTKEVTPFNEKIQETLFFEKEGALQSAIRIGRKLPNKLHEDYFGLQILNTVLGGYFGSRLMKNIREDKGYTYGIGSGISSFLNGAYFYISTEVGSDVTKNALDEIYKEVELIRTEEISVEELDLVKNYLLGQLLKSCDGPFNMAALFENVHFYGLDYDFYNNYIHTIKEITPKTLLALGVKYFNKFDLTEVVVGKI